MMHGGVKGLLFSEYNAINSRRSVGMGGDTIYGSFFPAAFAARHRRAAAPGRRREMRTWVIALSSMTLPAWCAAARGMGTRYSKVEIPRRTWMFAMVKAARIAVLARGGRAERTAGRRVERYRAAVLK